MANNNPKISVIIPTYNRAHLLPRAIESVLKQTFKDFELIIVDDASINNTNEIINKYKKKDKRIQYLKHNINSGGPAKPKNTAIKISKGEYIAFLDSDDEWFENKLKKQIKVYEDHKNSAIGLVGCQAIKINEITKEKKLIQPPDELEIRSPESLKKTVPVSFSSVMIKKSVFKEVGLIDETIKVTDDTDLYIRISRKYKFLFIQEPLINYRVHNNNISEQNIKRSLKRINNKEKIIEKYKNIYKKYPNIYANELKKLGTFYMLENKDKIAKKYFIQAIKVNIFSKIYINLLLSFSPRLYKKILSIKKSVFER